MNSSMRSKQDESKRKHAIKTDLSTLFYVSSIVLSRQKCFCISMYKFTPFWVVVRSLHGSFVCLPRFCSISRRNRARASLNQTISIHMVTLISGHDFYSYSSCLVDQKSTICIPSSNEQPNTLHRHNFLWSWFGAIDLSAWNISWS